MPIDRHNLRENLVSAWDKALQQVKVIRQGDGADNHWTRAKIWVDAVGDRFRTNYPEPDRVFWEGNAAHRTEFKKNELLFDIMVCSIATIDSFQRPPQPLAFIDQCHWQVESELNNKDTREIVIDMSKLVAGSAAHKLMIAAYPETAANRKKNGRALLCRCAKIAARCVGEVYFCFIAHPREWDSNPKSPALYEYTARGWELR